MRKAKEKKSEAIKLRISLIVNTPIGHRERSGATLDVSFLLEGSLPSRRPL